MVGPTFSRREVQDILIALLSLAFVFSYPAVLSEPLFFLISVFVLGIAFMGHELSHKFIARRFGYRAEFQLWPAGILMALLFAVITDGGLVFAAPGAVVFSAVWAFQRANRHQVGRIGLAGPLFNLISFAVLTGLFLLIPLNLFRFAAIVNAWLALFNLIPFGPLDGAKVLAWDWRIWLLSILAAIGGFVGLGILM